MNDKGRYHSLAGSLIASAKNGAKRLDQIQRWLGPDGVIIFDEAHKAKNALAGGRGEPTLTGQAVIDLQDASRNPEYRVVYSSATRVFEDLFEVPDGFDGVPAPSLPGSHWDQRSPPLQRSVVCSATTM